MMNGFGIRKFVWSTGLLTLITAAVYVYLCHGPSRDVIESCHSTITRQEVEVAFDNYVYLDFRESAMLTKSTIPISYKNWNWAIGALVDRYESGMVAVLRCDPGCTASFGAFCRLRLEMPFLDLRILANE